MKTLTSNSLVETAAIAFQFAHSLKPGSVVALSGPLGSGKTTFTQALARSLGVSSPITSPTYTFIRQHHSDKLPAGLFYHIDLYHLKSPQHIKNFDLPELITEHTHVIAIEWPEKVSHLLPSHTIRLDFAILGNASRAITINQPVQGSTNQ